jgi:hypothetical protein
MATADAAASAALAKSSHDCRLLISEAYWDARASAATAACQSRATAALERRLMTARLVNCILFVCEGGVKIMGE